MPAGSSGRESPKPRQDKVWGELGNIHLTGKTTPSPACHVFTFSVRLRTLPVWRWSQERNLARIRTNFGLLHAEKWSEQYGLWWKPVGTCLLSSLTLGSPCFPQDVLEYKKKQRPQKIKMLDGAIKTIMVDDSKTVGELLVTICSRIGIWLYELTSLGRNKCQRIVWVFLYLIMHRSNHCTLEYSHRLNNVLIIVNSTWGLIYQVQTRLFVMNIEE